MNPFRLIADMSHLFAILFLVYKMCKSRCCTGVSGKAQILLLMVFLTRYLDVFTVFFSYYNTCMKFLFIASTAVTVFLIFHVYKPSYNAEHDTFPVVFLLVPAAGLALGVNHEFSFFEVMWTFSIYLEAVAIFPQFSMIKKTGQMEMFTYHYLFALGIYRSFYIANWIYRYKYQGYFDAIAFWAGCVQTACYCYLLYTKEFLRWQAQAQHREYMEGINREVAAEKDKENQKLLSNGSDEEEEEGEELPPVEEKAQPPVYQSDNIPLPKEETNSVNRTTQQLNPPQCNAAQPSEATSLQKENNPGNATPPSADADDDDDDEPVGEDYNSFL